MGGEGAADHGKAALGVDLRTEKILVDKYVMIRATRMWTPQSVKKSFYFPQSEQTYTGIQNDPNQL